MSNVILTRKEDVPEELPLLPVRGAVFFPGGVLPISVKREKTIRLLDDVTKVEFGLVAVAAQLRKEEEDPKPSDICSVGTVARVVKGLKTSQAYTVVIQGLARFRVKEFTRTDPYFTVRLEPLEPVGATDSAEARAAGQRLKTLASEVMALIPELPAAAAELVRSIEHPSHLADLVAANLDIELAEKQAVLETLEVVPRLERVIGILEAKKAILEQAKP